MDNTQQKVLIIEDSALLRAVVREALESEGFVVTEAPNGKEGLAVALAAHPDLIMLDLMMPVMGGIEMHGLLRQDAWGATVPVIILTGTKDEKIGPMLSADPHLDFLLKENWMMDEVVMKVKKGLGMDVVIEHVKRGLGMA